MFQTYLLTNKTAINRGYDVSNNDILDFYNEVKNVHSCNIYWYCNNNMLFKPFVGIIYRGVLFKIKKTDYQKNTKYIIKTVGLQDKIKFGLNDEKIIRKMIRKVDMSTITLTFDSIELILKDLIKVYSDFINKLNETELD